MNNFQNFCIPLKERMTLLEYAYVLQKFGAFHAPRQFQRPIAWKSENRKNFFVSLLLNRAEGTYVLVDVEKCIQRLERVSDNSKTLVFFREFLSEGYEYVILDGNNRMTFINDLFNDVYSIPAGKYEFITDGVNGTISSFVVRKGKQKFSDLPDRVRKVLREREASISLYTQITLQGMSDVFQNVNDGVPLNPQELRNAYSTPWAEYVRNISDEICALLAKLWRDHVSRLRGEEWIVDCLDLTIQAISISDDSTDDNSSKKVEVSGVNQTSKNRLYKSDFLTEEDQHYYFDKFVELMDFVDRMIDQKVLDDNDLTRASAVQNLYWMMCNGLDTYDQVVSAAKLHNLAYYDKNRTFVCGEDEKNFKECCNGMSAENLKVRYTILTEIISKVTSNEYVAQ